MLIVACFDLIIGKRTTIPDEVDGNMAPDVGG